MSAPRKFDWDEARTMRQGGMTLAVIAAHFGVSDTAVWLACDERARAKAADTHKRWQQSGVCIDCGEPRTRNPTKERRGEMKGRCTACAAKVSATSVRPDSLQCYTCREWKHDSDFCLNQSESHRRGRHGNCRVCLTALKRGWRERNPEKSRESDRIAARRRRDRQKVAA